MRLRNGRLPVLSNIRLEDEAIQRQLLVEYLRVTGVDGGPALCRLVDRELPALVLLDVGPQGGCSIDAGAKLF